MPSNIITGIDIGTGSIKVVCARRNEETSDFEVLAKTQRPSLGVKKGTVSNPEETADTISKCIKDIEVQINQKIQGAYVNLNGSHITSSFSRGLVSVSRADQKISSEDIERVVEAAKTFPISKNREIMDVFPKEYIIDGEEGIKDPLDMEGVRFESEVLIIEGFSQYIKNTTQSLLNADIQVNDLSVGVLASAKSVLSNREKERGVAIIDLGASTTSLAVFEEENLLHLSIFPFGSNNITNDIAIGLKTDIDTAEKIKLEFGSCSFSKKDKKNETIESLESQETISFSRSFLRKIIEARVSEMLDLTKQELKKISKNEMLPAGIVITGGGSLLTGIVELVKKELKLPCRIGNPLNFNPPIDEPKFSVACGLVALGHETEGDHYFKPLSKTVNKIKKIFKSLIP